MCLREMDTYELVQLKAQNINCFVKYTPRDAGDKPSGRGGALKTIPPGNSIFFFVNYCPFMCKHEAQRDFGVTR